MSKVKLQGGANTVTLNSGDTGFYVDLTTEDIESLSAAATRDLPHGKEGVRVFVSPSQFETGYYKNYLTIAQNV